MTLDYDAVAREVSKYLDKLGPDERPMDCIYWGDVLSVPWTLLENKARRHPDSDWGRVIARHKALKAAWRVRVVEAAGRKLGVPGHVASVARRFGLTVKQVAGIIQHARKVGDLPPSERPKRVRREP